MEKDEPAPKTRIQQEGEELRARSTKSENKTVAEKATKVLSDKKQTELDHLQGKHRESIINDCSFCKRRNVRDRKKIDRTKAFFAGQKK